MSTKEEITDERRDWASIGRKAVPLFTDRVAMTDALIGRVVMLTHGTYDEHVDFVRVIDAYSGAVISAERTYDREAGWKCFIAPEVTNV